MLEPILTRAVSKRLRPRHERVRAIVVGRLTSPRSKFKTEGEAGEVDDVRRMLALVANTDAGHEEAGILVFRDTIVGELRIETAVPLSSSFKPSVVQAKAPDSSRANQTMEQSDMVLSVGEAGMLAISKVDTQALSDFLALAKEYDSEDTQPLASGGSHYWLRWYNPALLSAKVAFGANNYHQYLRAPTTKQELSLCMPGAPGDEMADTRIIQEQYIRDEMCRRIDEYSTARKLTLRIGTFNVNGKSPGERLSSFLGVEEELPDIFVFGFQELDLSTEAFLYLSTTEKEDMWCDGILEDLGDASGDYIKLISKQLVGMLIVVLIKRDLRPNVHAISSVASGQGVMWMGNKGGVAIRFRIFDTVFTFVNAHLAAFDEMVERRNADYAELRRALRFQEPESVPAEEVDYALSGTQTSGIFSSDYTFWMVSNSSDELVSYSEACVIEDQNYRIDLPDGDIRELIRICQRHQDFSCMHPFDQLTEQKRQGHVFADLSEATIRFPPTYKFELGQTLGSLYDAKRRPAWTDRILCRNAPYMSLEQTSYTSHPSICISDHKPVSATFGLASRTFKLEQMLQFLEKTCQPLTRELTPNVRPTVSIAVGHVDFDTVVYGIPSEKFVDLTNTSQVACSFRLAQPTAAEPACPSWLHVTPSAGVVLPGEKQTLRLSILIDANNASPFNEGSGNIRDLLIIRILYGKEHTLSVSGQFKKTCFGNRLEWLASLPDAVRKVESGTLKARRPGSGAPREVVRMVSWLMSNAAEEDGLFSTDGNQDIERQLIECLDSGDEFPSLGWGVWGGAALKISMAQTLVHFIGSFIEPVIPWAYHSRCALALNRDQAFEILENIPPPATNVIITITAFIHFILQKSNGDRAAEIASLLGSVLLKDDPDASPTSWISPSAKARFIRYLIS